MIREILNPDLYHGHRKKENFFEGWYFKISDSNKKYNFAFIPGIFFSKDQKHSHSFIQIVNGKDNEYNYLKYNTCDFNTAKTVMDININKNSFSFDGISLDIEHSQVKIKGKIYFSNIKKWPDTFLNPGSMGFYNYLTFMQCYSQVCAMDIDLSGSILVNGEKISFDNGKGYIEKNWGKDFPYSWIWIQGNQFKNSNASISCSVGHIPFFLGSFRGFLIGLMINDDFYEFTTMNKSEININQIDEDVEVQVKNKKCILNIKAWTKKNSFMTLLGPRDNKMIPLVNETLVGRVRVELIDVKSNRTIFDDITDCAGIEYGGDQMMVLDSNI